MLQHIFKTTFYSIFSLTILNSCSKEKVSGGSGTGQGTGTTTGTGDSNNLPQTVVGRAVDPQGNPISGARVIAEYDIINAFTQVFTDANGYYHTPRLEFGGWVIYAWNDIQYQDHTYHLRMGMPSKDDYGSFQLSSTVALTRNFARQHTRPHP